MIKLTHVTKEYSRTGAAVKDMSLQVGKGEFVFLTGHSGAGKSTVLKLIHMAERPSSGEVEVSGYSSRSLPESDVWKVRRRVGFIFQDFRLLPGRTATENVSFALEVTGTRRKDIVPRAQRLLAQVGLAAKAGMAVHELSGGEQQRVSVARALVNDPLVLLADEPTGNLDERSSRGIVDLFRDINARGTAIVMATHDLEQVREHGQARTLELDQGRLVYDSSIVEVAP